MRILLTAQSLVAAFSAAILAADARSTIEALGHAHLSAGEGGLKVVCNNLDYAIVTAVPTKIEEPGQCAPSAAALHGLAKGFAADVVVSLALDATTLLVSSGRSRFRLSTIPVPDLPTPLQISAETGQVVVDAEPLRAVLRHTEFAIANDDPRHCLNGIHLDFADQRLTATASDGSRAARASVVAHGTLQHGVIVPAATVMTLMKLLKGCTASVRLRASKSLIEVTVNDTTLTSKLIDGVFPSFEHVIPKEPSHRVIAARIELEQALERLAAIVPPKQELPAVIDLEWSGDVLRLSMRESALEELGAHDVMGSGKVAAKLGYLRDALEHSAGARVRLAGNGERQPLLVTDPASDDTLFLIAAVSRRSKT